MEDISPALSFRPSLAKFFYSGNTSVFCFLFFVSFFFFFLRCFVRDHKTYDRVHWIRGFEWKALSRVGLGEN